MPPYDPKDFLSLFLAYGSHSLSVSYFIFPVGIFFFRKKKQLAIMNFFFKLKLGIISTRYF